MSPPAPASPPAKLRGWMFPLPTRRLWPPAAVWAALPRIPLVPCFGMPVVPASAFMSNSSPFSDTNCRLLSSAVTRDTFCRFRIYVVKAISLMGYALSPVPREGSSTTHLRGDGGVPSRYLPWEGGQGRS